MELSKENLVKQGTTMVKLMGQEIEVRYRLHKEFAPNPDDPAGNPVELWYLYVPRCNTCYMDHSEERVFEDMHACFQEDFILYTAKRLNEEREKREKEENDES